MLMYLRSVGGYSRLQLHLLFGQPEWQRSVLEIPGVQQMISKAFDQMSNEIGVFKLTGPVL